MLINHSWLDTLNFTTEVNTLSLIFNVDIYNCFNKERSFRLNNHIKSLDVYLYYIRVDKYWYKDIEC